MKKRFVLAVLSIASTVHGAEVCHIDGKGYFQGVTASEPTVHFYDLKNLDPATAVEKKVYIVPGDLVMTANPENITDAPTKTLAAKYFCAEYRSPQGKVTRGWLPTSRLTKVYDDNGEHYAISDSLHSFLKSLGDATALAEGSLWLDGKKAGAQFIDIKFHTSDKGKVIKYDKNSFQFTDRVASYVPTNPDECGYKFILMNNAIVLGADVHSACWGNHGDSDPSGVYYLAR